MCNLNGIPLPFQQAGWTEDQLLPWVGPQPQHTAAPQAKETNVYLQYIIDHYEQLPETTVFMHAHRWVRCDVAAVVSRKLLDPGGNT